MNITSSCQALLLTGAPGTGKTTLIKEALSGFHSRAGGFYTEEVRQRGVRLGFDLVTLAGERVPLARVAFASPYRVGKYGVNLEAMDEVGVPALMKAVSEKDLAVIDEIGKMELFSSAFRSALWTALARVERLLGTIMNRPNVWADQVKKAPGVCLLTVTRENRSQVMDKMANWLAIEPAKESNRHG